MAKGIDTLSELKLLSRQKEEELKALMKNLCKSIVYKHLSQYASDNPEVVK